MYDPVLMAELIKSLAKDQKTLADAISQRDFKLRLIAELSGTFGHVPEILDDSYRKNILALVHQISGNRQNAIVQMPSNGKGAH